MHPSCPSYSATYSPLNEKGSIQISEISKKISFFSNSFRELTLISESLVLLIDRDELAIMSLISALDVVVFRYIVNIFPNPNTHSLNFILL